MTVYLCSQLLTTPRPVIPRCTPRKKRATTNKSGITGVYWQKGRYQGWAVTWGDSCVKCTRDFFEACCIRKSLEAHNK